MTELWSQTPGCRRASPRTNKTHILVHHHPKFGAAAFDKGFRFPGLWTHSIQTVNPHICTRMPTRVSPASQTLLFSQSRGETTGSVLALKTLRLISWFYVKHVFEACVFNKRQTEACSTKNPDAWPVEKDRGTKVLVALCSEEPRFDVTSSWGAAAAFCLECVFCPSLHLTKCT